MRKETLQYLYWVLAGTVFVLFLVGLAAFRNLQRAQGYGELVTHTNRVLLKTEETISLLKDAETSVRGYLLTHNYDFLDPYYASITKIEPALHELEILTKDNEKQRGPIKAMQELTNQRFKMVNRLMIISLSTSDHDTLYDALLQGKVVMDSIIVQATRVQKEEHRLLVEREKIQSELSALTPFWLGLISLLAVLLFSATFIAVILELTKRWRYENQLEQAVADLKKSNEELENFVYVASHHFQEPLRKMQTFSDRLTNKYQSSLQGDAAFLLTRVNKAAARMQELMDDLLVYLHIGRQPEPDEFQSQKLSTLLHTFLTERETIIKAAQGDISIAADDALPEVCCSAVQLRTLLEQLLDNSLKFVRENNKPVVKIRTFVTDGKDIPGASKEDMERKFCGIEFSDNGIGFDVTYEDKIFQLFQRLHHTHEYPGTGIGLTICRKVVANHRGYLQVESKVSFGTTFYIYLPLSA